MSLERVSGGWALACAVAINLTPVVARADPSASLAVGLTPAATRGDPSTTLVGHWSFDAKGGARALDVSGHDRHATLVGNAERGDGAVGRGLTLAGDPGHLLLPAGSFDGWRATSVAAWVEPRAGGAGRFRTLFEASGGPRSKGSPRLWLGLNAKSGNWLCRLTTDAGEHHRQGFVATAALGRWVHVVWVIDLPRGVIHLFVNGKRRASATGLTLDGARIAGSSAGALLIGGSSVEPDHGWRGGIDELRIYRGALSRDEVARLYAESPPPPSPPRPSVDPGSLIAHWSFERPASPSASQSAIPNRVGDAHAGTMVGAPRLVPCKIGTGIALDGKRDAVRIAGEALFDGWNAVSVAAWVRPEKGGKGSWPTLIEKASGAEPKHPHVLWVGRNGPSGKWAFQLATDLDENYFHSFGVRLPYGQWSHVVTVVNIADRSAQLFVNGELAAQREALPLLGTTLALHPTGACAVGMIAAGENNYWKGQLDEVMVFRGALSAAEARALHSGG